MKEFFSNINTKYIFQALRVPGERARVRCRLRELGVPHPLGARLAAEAAQPLHRQQDARRLRRRRLPRAVQRQDQGTASLSSSLVQ